MNGFKKIYVEITNVCNLACDFCPQSKRKSEFMEIDLFEKILNQIQGYTKYIYFHVKGEPLLHPEIDKFLDLSEQYGFHVNITTNGTLIKKAKKKIINKAALRQVNFSLHSFDANEENEEIENYLKEIFDFAKERVYSDKPIVSLRLWNLEESKAGPFKIESSQVKKISIY